MNKHWVAAWGTSPSIAERLPAQYAKDITLRYTLKTTIGGSAIRLHFGNAFGSEAVTLTRVTANGHEVLFGGQSECRMDAHGEAVSDPLDMDVQPGDDVAVSIYLGEMTRMDCGCAIQGPFCRGCFAYGDRCGEAEFSLLWRKETDWHFFLTRMDVLAEENAHAFVAFGDSITSQSWPDWLVQRLLDEGRSDLSIIRRGISGSRILREYENPQHIHYGPEGMKRFEKEVCIDGATSVLILHGINDIIHPDGQHPCRPWAYMPTVDDLIEGLRKYIAIARSHGLKVYVATMTAIRGWRTDSDERQAIRSAVNEWIRTTDEIDGVVDFDAATHDPMNPLALLPECDSGDHLHPSIEGAKRMAKCIPEDYLK